MPITEDPARLATIAGQLGEAIDGMRSGTRVRLPVIQRADAAGLNLAMDAALDDAIAERTAAIANQGITLACNKGCNACCVAPLVVTEGEIVTVVEWLALPANAAVREKFVAALPVWKRTLGDAAAEVVRTSTSRSTDDERRTAAIAYTRKGAMCAFNHDGACSIYPARPARCRLAHALRNNSHCGANGDGQIDYYRHERAETMFEEQEEIRGAIHHALRPNADYDLLCAGVDRLLGATASIGRNDPCPCGSGKKYKRCCG